MGLFFFLRFVMNVAALGTGCRGTHVLDFKQSSSRRSNAAALGSQCCGIECFDFQKFFSCNSNVAALSLKCCDIGYTDLFSS